MLRTTEPENTHSFADFDINFAFMTYSTVVLQCLIYNTFKALLYLYRKLTLWWVCNSSHKDETVSAVFIDEKEKGSVHNKACLCWQRHETHMGECCCFSALLIYCDDTLMLKLKKWDNKWVLFVTWLWIAY